MVAILEIKPRDLALAVGIDGALAATWAPLLTAAINKYDVKDISAFIAQLGHESASFSRLVENLNYSAEGLAKTWPKRFSEIIADPRFGPEYSYVPNAAALRIARNPVLIANTVYAGVNGNIRTGDGWTYRGRGLIQLTGRANYAAEGYENAPEALTDPATAANVAASWWVKHKLDGLPLATVTKRINGGLNGQADRQARYVKAMKVFAV